MAEYQWLQGVHTNVDFLAALLSDTTSVVHSISHNHQLRQCAREIQRQLHHEGFLALLSSLIEPLSMSSSPLEARTSEIHQRNQIQIYEVAVADLLRLATMATATCNDACASELLKSLQGLALQHLRQVSWLSPALARDLLDHIISRMQPRGAGSSMETLRDAICLFNRHVTNQEQLQEILTEERSAFASSCIALEFMKDHLGNSSSGTTVVPMELAVFIDGLISLCTIRMLETVDSSDDYHQQHDQGLTNTFQSFETSLVCGDASHSGMSLGQDARSYIDSLQEYGTQLVEMALQMLEQANQTRLQSESQVRFAAGSKPGQTDPWESPASQDQEEQLDPARILAVLQYTTLATNFLCTIHITPLPFQAKFRGMDRSLLRELVHFLVGDRTETQASAQSTPDVDDFALQTLTMDALGRLLQLQSHWDHPEDYPLILASILFGSKSCEYGTTWPSQSLREALATIPPESAATPAQRGERKSFGHCLQSILVSHAYFPSQQFAVQPVMDLYQCLLENNEQVSKEQAPDASRNRLGERGTCPMDPWESWVRSQSNGNPDF